MQLYRHYKGQLYKALGTATHSESLEQMMIYEAVDSTKEPQRWTRPKQMFEEAVVIDGKPMARFSKVEISCTCHEQWDPFLEPIIANFLKVIFGEWDPKWFYGTLKRNPSIALHLAHIEQKCVGFKLGYPLDAQTFYSWLGGVIPSHQGLGIAQRLMAEQHQWCIDKGFKRVQTKTQNRWRKMLLLNIKNGFEIIGYHSSNEGGPKIVLEKNLM